MNHQPNTPASLNEAVANFDVRQFLAAVVIRNRKDCGLFPQVADEVDADDAAYHRILKLIDFYYPRSALAAPGAAIDAREQEAIPEPVKQTYASTQATNCAGCGKHKHTPLRIDAMGGYVCLTCIDQKLGTLLGEFGYPDSARSLLSEIEDWLAELKQANLNGHVPQSIFSEASEFAARIEAIATPSEALSPATVAQPVAYVNGDELDNMLDDRTAVIQGTRSGFRNTPLYAAAQPCASQGCGGLVERLKQEAQIHAQEARTANSTIAEIYRIVTGGTGEPGNWNGAEPVRKCIEDLRAQVAALSTAPRSLDGATPGGKE